MDWCAPFILFQHQVKSPKNAEFRKLVKTSKKKAQAHHASSTSASTSGCFVESLTFFNKINEVDTTRDYTIIVDMSASMSGERWEQAREAVAYLAPHAVKCDPDGIALYFFDHSFSKYEHVKSVDEVLNMFELIKPRGRTDLASVLKDAVEPDNVKKRNFCCCLPCFGSRKKLKQRDRAETILVITDGVPDDKKAVEDVIVFATKFLMSEDEDLSITFIQVGDDHEADIWLQHLDDDLVMHGADFDIVDKMSFSMMKGTSFVEIIKSSLTS